MCLQTYSVFAQALSRVHFLPRYLRKDEDWLFRCLLHCVFVWDFYFDSAVSKFHIILWKSMRRLSRFHQDTVLPSIQVDWQYHECTFGTIWKRTGDTRRRKVGLQLPTWRGRMYWEFNRDLCNARLPKRKCLLSIYPLYWNIFLSTKNGSAFVRATIQTRLYQNPVMRERWSGKQPWTWNGVENTSVKPTAFVCTLGDLRRCSQSSNTERSWV